MFMFSEDDTEKEEVSEDALDEVLEETDDDEHDPLMEDIASEEEGKDWV